MRVLRYSMGAVSAALSVGLVGIYAAADVVSAGAAALYAVLVLGSVAVFAVAFFSGLNRRFADPSLTTAQLIAAGIALAGFAYAAGDRAWLALPFYVTPLLFGAFRVATKPLLAMLLFYLVGYAAASAAGGGLDNAAEQLAMLTAVVMLTQVVWLGGYVNRMRLDLRRTNDELEGALRRIERVASLDELTGLYNRRMIRDLLTREEKLSERTGAKLTIAMIDVDHFKSINDDYGHSTGDAVLRAVAEALQSGLRESDLLGRYGGEEFVVGLPGCAAERAELPLQRIRSALVGMQPVEAAPSRKVTVSIGAALRRDSETIDDVIARADAALYEAKRAGRDRVVWAA